MSLLIRATVKEEYIYTMQCYDQAIGDHQSNTDNQPIKALVRVLVRQRS